MMKDFYCLRFISIFILLPIFVQINVASAGDISYEITTYGGRHAVILLVGDRLSGVNTNMGADGMSIRISSNESSFAPGSKQVFGTLVSDVQQVKRGNTSDLVINLSAASDISITPGASDIKLIVKAKRSAAQSPAIRPTPSSTIARSAPTGPLPIKFIGLKDYSKDPRNGRPATITIVLPEPDSVNGLLQASLELRNFAYVIDLAWSWISGTPLSGEAKVNIGTSNCAPQNNSTEIIELEGLVRDLTQELVELRKIKYENETVKH